MIEIPATAPETIEAVIASERDRLLRLAFLLVGSREAAEDIVQTAFLAAHQRWSALDRPGAYLHQVVVNQAKDHHRRAHRRPPAPPEGTTGIPEIDATWEEILKLPQTQRDVVVLRYYQDLPLREIADLLGRPASTVRSDLRRALARLRRAMT